MKLKTSELTGAALDWAVVKAEVGVHPFAESLAFRSVRLGISPSTNWAIGGPLIEREKIEVRKGNDLYFPQGNENGDYYEPLWLAGKQHGPTPLVAAMRCYVASKLGEEIEIFEELA